MRDDLLDAQNSVRWAEAQIPILQERFLAWQRSSPYELVMENDPNPAYQLLVARQRLPLDPLIGPEIGAILNAARSGLDLLAAALATRNGVKPDRETHFPIYKTVVGAADLKRGLDSTKVKKWLSPSEIATIKTLKPYAGGDETLFVLNELDILRKHVRLIVVEPLIGGMWIAALRSAVEPAFQPMDDKTILYRVPGGFFRPTKGNTNVTASISFNEPALGLVREPAFSALHTKGNRHINP